MTSVIINTFNSHISTPETQVSLKLLPVYSNRINSDLFVLLLCVSTIPIAYLFSSIFTQETSFFKTITLGKHTVKNFEKSFNTKCTKIITHGDFNAIQTLTALPHKDLGQFFIMFEDHGPRTLVLDPALSKNFTPFSLKQSEVSSECHLPSHPKNIWLLDRMVSIKPHIWYNLTDIIHATPTSEESKKKLQLYFSTFKCFENPLPNITFENRYYWRCS